MLLLKSLRGFDVAVYIFLVLAIHIGAGFVEIDCAVLAVLVSACGHACQIFRNGSFHGPHERMNRAEHEHWSLFVPPRFAQRLATVGIWMRFESPCGVR